MITGTYANTAIQTPIIAIQTQHTDLNLLCFTLAYIRFLSVLVSIYLVVTYTHGSLVFNEANPFPQRHPPWGGGEPEPPVTYVSLRTWLRQKKQSSSVLSYKI